MRSGGSAIRGHVSWQDLQGPTWRAIMQSSKKSWRQVRIESTNLNALNSHDSCSYDSEVSCSPSDSRLKRIPWYLMPCLGIYKKMFPLQLGVSPATTNLLYNCLWRNNLTSFVPIQNFHIYSISLHCTPRPLWIYRWLLSSMSEPWHGLTAG